MGFDPHTYLSSACNHCYTLFTCIAVTTLPFWISPQRPLPDGADTGVLCSTDVVFLLFVECSLPSASPSPLLTLLSIPYDIFLTNFTCTLPLSSYPYFCSSLLPVIVSFVSSSKSLPKCVLSV